MVTRKSFIINSDIRQTLRSGTILVIFVGKGNFGRFVGPETKIINQTRSDPTAPPKRPGAKYRRRDKSLYIQWEAPCSLESGKRNVTYALNITDDVGKSVYFKPAPSTKRKNTFVIREGLTRGAHYFITVDRFNSSLCAIQQRTSRTKASYGQRFPCSALLSPWF